jgi:CHAT domain-containing protein
LSADIVVLSACDTSGSDGHMDSEGFSGLTSAFLFAGARNVVATLWPVETQATKFLTTRMLKHYVSGAEPGAAFALRRATLELIRSADGRRAHPAFWSAFVVVGQ